MLTGTRMNSCAPVDMPRPDDRYSRNLKEDLKAAMDLLISFKESLEKLHPECIFLIEKLLQNTHNRY